MPSETHLQGQFRSELELARNIVRNLGGLETQEVASCTSVSLSFFLHPPAPTWISRRFLGSPRLCFDYEYSL